MAVEVALNTPLSDALSNVVQPKLSEVGWSTGGPDDSALGEYIILMLVNGKTQDQIAAELSNDLLNLPPEDSGATEFAKWLFAQVEELNKQFNGTEESLMQSQAASVYPEASSRSIDERDEIMGEAMNSTQSAQIPTGPKSMRNSSRNGNRRMMGQISKAMDRSGDTFIHRVRPQHGTERINSHTRQPPRGPRSDQNRPIRPQSNFRTNGVGNGAGPAPMMHITPQQQMQLMAMYEEQARMMSQIFSPQQQQQQLQQSNIFLPGVVQQGHNPGFANINATGQQTGRSLFDRVEGPTMSQNGHFSQRVQQGNEGFQSQARSETILKADGPDLSSSMEVESSQQKPPEETLCRFNLKCTKQDCPYAHQSSAAPAGTTIDVNDVCPFGAACMNRKCVGRHPSPAQKVAYKSEQDCKFSFNCKNPTCAFRHPTMPVCRNGADCRIEGCKFTHVKIPCKYNPCKNPSCPYKHEEGQKGVYSDKVWKAEEDEDSKHAEDTKLEDQAHEGQESGLDVGVVT